jgi:putative ABC transport system permease protein
MQGFLGDVRFALRHLLRHRAFAFVGIASLAVGIGATTAVFHLAHALLFGDLPVADPARLVSIASTLGGESTPLATSWPNFLDLRRDSEGLGGLGLYSNRTFILDPGSGGDLERVEGQMVSGNFFELLGVAAWRGRTFTGAELDDEAGPQPVAVLSHRFWLSRFGGDPGVVGSKLLLNGQPLTIVGVAPRRFSGVAALYPTEVFVPVSAWRQLLTGDTRARFEERAFATLNVFARLLPGTSLRGAQEELESVARRMAAETPQNARFGVLVQPLARGQMKPKARRQLTLGSALLMGGAGMVLLIACVNLSSVLLSRLLVRQRELAIRTAVGASRARLARMLITESCVLSLLGGGAGFFLALWFSRLFWALRPPQMPESAELSVDGTVFTFALGVTLVAGLLIGLAPALAARRRQLAEMLRGKSFVAGLSRFGARWSLRNLLVSLQIALSFVSLVAGAMFLQALARARTADVGFEPKRLLVASFDAGAAGYEGPRALDLYDRIVERLGPLPGVESAAVADGLNLYPVGYLQSEIHVETEPPDRVRLVQVNMTSPGYLRTVGIPLVEGRDFDRGDDERSLPVAVVNSTMASTCWPGESAVGKRFAITATGQFVEVIGVARDARYRAVDEEPMPYIYRPIRQLFSSPVYLHVRTSGDPLSVAAEVRRELRELAPQLALTDLRTIGQVLERSLWASRVAASLLSGFGFVALLLSMLGLYGALDQSVRGRQHEIGLRMAVGASRTQILKMELRQGLRYALTGLGGGLALALVGGRLAYAAAGLPWKDPVSYGGAALLLLAIALLTNLFVARRATGVDPVRALNVE